MNKKESLSLGLFLVSLFLIGFVFFFSINTTVTLVIDNGVVIEEKIPATFTLFSTVFLMILSMITAVSLFYFSSDFSKKLYLTKNQKFRHALLEGDEKIIYEYLLEKGGECIQKDIVYELKYPKAKVTRVLDKLEQKSIVVRVSYGNTNKIVVKE